MFTNFLLRYYRFRWVFCQLDKLRRCLPGRIRSALDELPRTLDMTYERTLEDIGEENWGYAHRLFQCIVVASRPLRIEELAEFLAVDFGSDGSVGTPTFVACWRPENPSNAVLSTCSSLIAVVTVDGRPVVQFSHFSVKEFLVSGRLASGQLSRYYISLEPAHEMVAQACLSVLLQLDNHIDKRSLGNYPLARYAAQHWLDHTKFPNVSSRAEHAMTQLFDRDRPHFAAWVWIYAMDQNLQRSHVSETSLLPDAPPIYYATLWNLLGLVEWLVAACSQDVNEMGGFYGTPLCAAAALGLLGSAQGLIKCGAQLDATGSNGWSPLLWASDRGYLELARLILDQGAGINFCDHLNRSPLSLASEKGYLDIAKLLLQHGSDLNNLEFETKRKLFWTLRRENFVSAQLPSTGDADVNYRNEQGLDPLHLACRRGNFASVRQILENNTNNPERTTCPEVGRRIPGAFFGPQYSRFVPIWSPRLIDVAKRIHLPAVEGEAQAQGTRIGPTTKRRALLVGISYYRHDEWWRLEGPHEDVNLLQNLLVGEYFFHH